MYDELIVDDAAIDRFMSKIVEDKNKCWVWQVKKDIKGYGLFKYRGSWLPAHRVSYDIFVGDPVGKHVCHHCDRPECVSPAHLYLGDDALNHKDSSTRGRRGKKLTAKQVIGIRNSVLSQTQLAKGLGVSVDTISDIQNFRTWKWTGVTL